MRDQYIKNQITDRLSALLYRASCMGGNPLSACVSLSTSLWGHTRAWLWQFRACVHLARMAVMLRRSQRPGQASQVALLVAQHIPRAPSLAQCAVYPLLGVC